MSRATFSSYLLLLLLLLFSISASLSVHATHNQIRSPIHAANAYGTILYVGTPRDYENFVAARVLLRSLACLHVDADLILFASIDVPQPWVHIFISEGVRVVRVENIPNPQRSRRHFDKRFKFSLNKLYAWSLVEYERIVMLDVDNLFLRKTDELFQCGQFCATFIDPCIFHTGLFVLEPSRKVYKAMLEVLAMGRDTIDGADQGFLTSYFGDLLDMPLFHPPMNGSRLRGHYRLPFGYQMDASYYYLRLKWRVPSSESSVVTFPGASWLKPWYWWSWPVLPLGLSWHDRRKETIGYHDEDRLLIAQAIFYLAVLILATAAWKGYQPAAVDSILIKACALKKLWEKRATASHTLTMKTTRPLCIVGSFVLPTVLIPTTVHPIAGWGMFLLGSFSLLVASATTLRVGLAQVLLPWLLCLTSLLVMVWPYYSNGIVRGISIFSYGAVATPMLWWSVRGVMMANTEGSERFESTKSSLQQSSTVMTKWC